MKRFAMPCRRGGQTGDDADRRAGEREAGVIRVAAGNEGKYGWGWIR